MRITTNGDQAAPIHVHPGLWLKAEIVEAFGMSATEVALHFGVSRQNMSMLLNGHANLTATMALCFEQVFPISADTLLRMQAAYNLAQARVREDELGVTRVRKATCSRGAAFCR